MYATHKLKDVGLPTGTWQINWARILKENDSPARNHQLSIPLQFGLGNHHTVEAHGHEFVSP